jgi:hypothetical protein
MRIIGALLLVAALVVVFICASARAQQSGEQDKADSNIERIENALDKLKEKKRLTRDDKKLRTTLKKTLARLKDMKKNMDSMTAELKKLNDQAEEMLKGFGGEETLSVELLEMARKLNKALDDNPDNDKARKSFEELLPKIVPPAYRSRWSKEKRAWKGKHPGTASAIAAALKWLEKHQDKNGQWDQDGFMKNCDTQKGAACDGQGTSQYDVGMTGMALLAFTADGNTHRTGQFRKTVKKCLDWLVGQQQGDGSLGPRLAESWVYNHAIGTTALCEAYAITRDPNLKEPARKAVEFILKAQNKGLGWEYEPQNGRSDTSVTSWMVQALKAAKDAGLTVPKEAFDGAFNWFDRATNTAGKCGYMRPGDDGSVINVNEHFAKQPVMTGAAVLCRLLCGQKKTSPKITKGIDILMANLPVWNKPKNDKVCEYYWYYATYAVQQFGGESWKKWSTHIKKTLLESQRIGMCADGSWDPVGKWGMVGGRVYSTAMNCLTLQAFYRYKREE